MPRLLKDLMIGEVSSVDRGAGHGVKVMLMKSDRGATEMYTPETIAKVLKQTADSELPDVIQKLFESGLDPVKPIVDLLESRIVKRPGDRTEHASYLASFTGTFPRDPVGKAILNLWAENDAALAGCYYRKRGPKPKAVPDTGNGRGQMPEGDTVDEGASELEKLITAEMQASKKPRAQATNAVMQTKAGAAAYAKERESRLQKCMG